MQQLSSSGLQCILPLIDASPMHSHRALAYAVVEGRPPGGIIFADHPTRPRSAVVCNLNGFFFAFGQPDDAWLPALTDLLVDPVTSESTAIFGESHAWKDLLRRAYEPLGAPRVARIGFALTGEPFLPPTGWSRQIPDELVLAPISKELAQGIQDGTLTGGYGIDPWFIRVAGGPQAYAENSLGVALVNKKDGQIASICGYCGLGGGEAELEVGTVPAYRGRGLAVIVSAAFIQQCQQKGWKTGYSTARANLPSIAVARKLGYAQIETIHGYELTNPNNPV